MPELRALQQPQSLLPLLDAERPLTEDVRYSLFVRGETPWGEPTRYLVDDPAAPALVLKCEWHHTFYARRTEDFTTVLDYLESTDYRRVRETAAADWETEARERLLGELHFGGLAERWCRLLRSRYRIEHENPCYVYYWDGPPPREPRIELRDLGAEHAELVEQHWEFGGHDEDSIAYIRWRLESGPAPAVFENDEPVAWCMTHGGGSMGNIFVLPEHRRRGLGLELTYGMIRRVLEGGWLPLCHIKQVNEASISMSEKAGLVCGGPVSWITARLD